MRDVGFVRGIARSAAGLGMLLVLTGRAAAVDTSTWEVAGPTGFSSAETEKISVTATGVAELAPKLEAVASPGEAYVWSIAADKSGAAYAGTGDNGLILRISKASKEGKADTLHDTVELEIMAITVGPDGAVYAGGSPDGVIVRLKDGKVETFFDSPESYVWALGFAENGDLYAATGDRGRLYRIGRDGQGEVWFDSDEVHLLSLVRGSSGHWIVGTSGAGLVLEVSGKDKARVLYDAPEEEIKALVRDPAGNLYFAAVGGAGAGNGGGGGGGGGGGQPSAAGDADAPAGAEGIAVIEVQPVRPSRRGGGESEREARGPRGSVYRQSPSGAVIRLWRAPEGMVNALEWEEDGSLLCGTGDDGAIYRLDGRGTATRLLETKESQVLALKRTGAGVLVGTANPGKVYRLGPGVEPEGTLTSKPFDAANVAAWGRISFEGAVPPGSEIELRTRSGNTEKPDESWSDWSNAISTPAGAEITSPTARFIQWQAKLTGRGTTSPELTAVKVAYRQENLPPRLQLVDVDDTGDRLTPGGADRSPDRVTVTLSNGVQAEFSRMQAGPRPVRRDQVPWLRDVKVANWLAEDPNGDKLEFDLFVRSEKEKRWRPLAEEVPDQTHAFPTASFADGRYQLRVVATDKPSNPQAGAMADSLDSTYFLVDNTPPAIAALRVERSGSDKLTVSATVTDELSSVRAFEYSLDARTWEPVFPEDGIFDSGEERFRFTIDLAAARAEARTEAARSRGPVTTPGLAGGEMVFVQAADVVGNEGSARAVAP